MQNTSSLVRNSLCTANFNPCHALLAVLSVLCFSTTGAHAQNPGSAPIHIPVAMWQKNANGIKKPRINIGIGDLPPLPVGFDTGSSGLHVFADANLMAPNSGVKCSDIATTVTYGNPPLITFSGVVCYASLHFGDYVSPAPVPIAYLTSASCPPQNPKCTIPKLTDPGAMGGYGIFGLGLTGAQSGDNTIPNPILTLPAPYGSSYSVRLTNGQDGGELVLGSDEPANSVPFHLTPTAIGGANWSNAKACLFVNGGAIDTCLQISFDTGNPVSWIHNANTPLIPQYPPGFVKPPTSIGFAPEGVATQTVSVVAGTTPFVDQIKVLDIANAPALTNTGIQVFFGQIVTYNNEAGTISFAPLIFPAP